MAKPDPTNKLLAELLEGKSPEEILGEKGLLDDSTKRLLEQALEGEMTHHLGYPPRLLAGQHTGNSRNGKTQMIVNARRASWRSPSRAIATATSNRTWSRNISGDYPGSMIR
jgi:hypothetical protein